MLSFLALLLDNPKTSMQREPGRLLHLELLLYVRLNTIHVRLILYLQMDQEVDVVPHFMILVRMHVEALFRFFLEHLPLKPADVAHVLHVLVLLARLLSQLGERVNDDAKDHVEEDRDHEQEEGNVEEESNVVGLFVILSSRFSR